VVGRDREHARAVAEKIKPLGVSWTINARANCDYETLKIMRDAGLRHVVVGFETGNDQILKNIKKGVTKAQALEFTRNCKKLGLSVHGAFVMGLPGETQETIRETIEFAKRLDINSIQVSLLPIRARNSSICKKRWITDSFLDEWPSDLRINSPNQSLYGGNLQQVISPSDTPAFGK
jgi:coproporphyrinogen III oxidase-like Fe-S oxidoreductase